LIYLEGSLEDILSRIKERGRPMEQQTPIAYWEEMHRRYEDWINNFNACPVLRLNINDYDIMANEGSIEPIVERVAHFIEQTRLLKK
jgi:deoxyadenosine/deoxycytidine kinase